VSRQNPPNDILPVPASRPDRKAIAQELCGEEIDPLTPNRQYQGAGKNYLGKGLLPTKGT
jgi:hypothetical protein